MKIGKLQENALQRSVLKEIKYKKEEVKYSAAVGRDCAIFLQKENGVYQAMTTAVITEPYPQAGKLAVYMAANNLAAIGAKGQVFEAAILLPGQCNEEDLKRIMRDLNQAAEELELPLVGGHTEITRAVRYPVLTVTAVGSLTEEQAKRQLLLAKEKKGSLQGDLVVTKWIALAGTALAAKKKEEELRKRFPAELVEDAQEFLKYLSVVPEAATAGKSNVKAMHDISRGGILGALWEMAEELGIGLEIDLKKIPIRQETVEICNYLDLNPYELLSTGSMLLLADNGAALVKELQEQGIPSVVIGKTTEGRDRLVRVDEEERFLTRPGTDEILKLFSKADEKGNLGN